MSGQLDSVETRLQMRQKELDDFETKTGIPCSIPIEVENEAKSLLEISPSALSQMNAEKCGEAAFLLFQFAFYLQKAVNKENSTIQWCEENLKLIVAKTVDQYTGYGYQERATKAILHNEAALKIDILRVEAGLRKNRICFLEDKVKLMGNALLTIQATKREVK